MLRKQNRRPRYYVHLLRSISLLQYSCISVLDDEYLSVDVADVLHESSIQAAASPGLLAYSVIYQDLWTPGPELGSFEGSDRKTHVDFAGERVLPSSYGGFGQLWWNRLIFDYFKT